MVTETAAICFYLADAFCPPEWLGIVIDGVDVVLDGLFELLSGAMDAPPQLLLGQNGDGKTIVIGEMTGRVGDITRLRERLAEAQRDLADRQQELNTGNRAGQEQSVNGT